MKDCNDAAQVRDPRQRSSPLADGEGTYAALMVKDWSAAFSMHRHPPLQGLHGYQYAGVTNVKNCSCSNMDTHIS